MKRLYSLILITLLFLTVACGSDDGPGVIPVANFSSDRTIVETGEAVTFTNSSEDGVSYSWDFGDDETSDEENPNHTYTTRGTFTVTLTTTSSTGDTHAQTSTITVGQRWMVGLVIESINLQNDNDAPWDTDNSGPELIFGALKATDQGFQSFPLGNDYEESDLPFSGSFALNNQQVLTNEDWLFVFLDNDEPFTDPNSSELMTYFELNPVTTPSDKDYETGEGSFHIQEGEYSLYILFEVRN